MKVRYIGTSEKTFLIHGKVYTAVGENSWLYLIVDEEGEEYGYPKMLFERVEG